MLVSVVDSLFDAGRSPSVQLDSSGNPALSYLLYQPVLKKGEIPPAIKPGDPQPPSVMLAMLAKGIWARTSVTPQKTSPETGTATEIANSNGQAIPGVNTSLALDAQGKHHVAWATPKGLFYSTDAGGSFGPPGKVSGGSTFGGSIAVGQDGTVWISFYADGALKVAHGVGGKWTTDDVQKSAAGTAGSTTAVTSAIRVDPKGVPVVAFGRGSATMVAARSGGGWNAQAVTGRGGYGVSLAVDKNGIAVASYDANGGIHEGRSASASIREGQGGPLWKVTDLGSTSALTAGQPDVRWSTGIATDDQGHSYVTWADTKANTIVLGTDRGGQFKSQAVQGSSGGANPSIAVSADGKREAVAWFDTVNANLDVASTSTGGLVLAFPTPTLGPPTAVAPSGPACQPSGSTTSLSIAAPAGASANGFDKTCLAVVAGKPFKVDFTNNDTPPIVHNWALFTNSSGTDQLGGGSVSQPVSPGQTQSYSIKALQPGQYFYRCDFHPTTMNGTFVVAKP